MFACHIIDKHENEEEKVEFEMKVLETFIHNPLGRQCSEAVWIRHTEPEKRINAKTEYHQPGDVEIRFEKSVNERTKNKKIGNRGTIDQ